MKLFNCAISLIIFLSCTRVDNKPQIEKVDYYEKCRVLCLSENKKGVDFFFKRNGESIDELTVTFLGTVITENKDSLKIINSANMFGAFEDVKNSAGRIFVYDMSNTLVGHYYLGAAWSLPKGISGDSLIFEYANDFCDQRTPISLREGIPKTIFINCTKEGGDLYSFVPKE